MSTTGVIVGRFQIHNLHQGHRFLIDQVYHSNDQTIIFLGVSGALSNRKNPLDFDTRKLMLQQRYPKAMILPVLDQGSDTQWSNWLDDAIKYHATGEPILYGGRDSFIPRYNGHYPTKEIESPKPFLNGSDIREHCKVRNSREFRSGVIYSAHSRPPIAYPTIDVAIIKMDSVLLGQKRTDPINKWRFIGGFVDPSDPTLEAAVRRETREEAGDIEIEGIRYICSQKVEDHRYSGTGDGIMTSFFLAHYVFGLPKAGDDLDSILWTPLDKLPCCLVAEHESLGKRLLSTLGWLPSQPLVV